MALLFDSQLKLEHFLNRKSRFFKFCFVCYGNIGCMLIFSCNTMTLTIAPKLFTQEFTGRM